MDRRDFLRATVTAVGSGAGSGVLAGCIGTENTVPGEEYPAVDEWLTETEVGGADDTYDGTVLDRRGTDEVQVDVGAEGNKGEFAFDPSAVVVSPGTTVRWVWTGQGGAHSVRAAPDEQLGESDYEFSSGDPVGEAGHEYAQSLDEEGIALYHCDGITGIHQAVSAYTQSFDGTGRSIVHYTPHLQLGMKGGVVVDDTGGQNG